MIRLLGWHWAFLPSAAAELIPGADLFPTWTAAVWFVTRQKVSAGADIQSSKSVRTWKFCRPVPPEPRR
jgi:hypothetical protein